MSKTLSDLRAKCYDILREEENTSAYPYSLIDDLINSAIQDICSGLVIHPITKEEVHKWQLPFLNREVFYTTYGIRYVSKDVNIGDNEIYCNTAWYPADGYLYIWGNIIKYGWKLDDRFTNCEDIIRDIKWGEQISYVYKLPNDFMSPVNVIFNDKYQIFNEDYDDVFERLRDIKWIPDYRYQRYRGYGKPFYAIKDDTYLVVYNINVSGLSLRLRYERMPDVLVNPNDVCVIPNDTYALNVVPYLAVWETMYNRWEETKGGELISWWISKLRAMYKFYNKTWIERGTSKNYWMGKSRLNV